MVFFIFSVISLGSEKKLLINWRFISALWSWPISRVTQSLMCSGDNSDCVLAHGAWAHGAGAVPFSSALYVIWNHGKKAKSVPHTYDIHHTGPKSCWLSSSLLFIYTSCAAGHDLNLNRICWLPFISTVSGFSSSKLERVCLRKEENPIKQAFQKMNLTSQILNLNINFWVKECL